MKCKYIYRKLLCAVLVVAMAVFCVSAEAFVAGAWVYLDVTESADGHIYVHYGGTDAPKMRILLRGPDGVQYQFKLESDLTETLPLMGGDGVYKIGVYKNIGGTRYRLHYERYFIAVPGAYAPYLSPNQMVAYEEGGAVSAAAAEITAGLTGDAKKIEAVYDYIKKNIAYDKKLADELEATGRSILSYLPNAEKTLEQGSGVCTDISVLTVAMLRSLGIPCKLVFGYAYGKYHAWVSVYSTVDMRLDRSKRLVSDEWNLLDPTNGSKFAQIGKTLKETDYAVTAYY
jgi:transglutaminase-like putative cysteine protease